MSKNNFDKISIERVLFPLTSISIPYFVIAVSEIKTEVSMFSEISSILRRRLSVALLETKHAALDTSWSLDPV